MSGNKLVLLPLNPEAPPTDPSLIRESLRHCGFADEGVLIYGDSDEMPGNQFLHLLRFAQQPAHGTLWAPHTIEISDPSDSIAFLGAGNVVDPSCPNCAYEVPDWIELTSEWYESPKDHQWDCPWCSETSKIWQLDWHQRCGFGRQWIAVWHVHEQEAVPSDSLLSILRSATGNEWTYFYYHL